MKLLISKTQTQTRKQNQMTISDKSIQAGWGLTRNLEIRKRLNRINSNLQFAITVDEVKVKINEPDCKFSGTQYKVNLWFSDYEGDCRISGSYKNKTIWLHLPYETISRTHYTPEEALDELLCDIENNHLQMLNAELLY